MCLETGSFHEYFKPHIFFEPKLKESGEQNKWAKETGDLNVSVLVYTLARAIQEHMRELKTEGNLRKECNLEFNCIFKQRYKQAVTADIFYSMDAVIVVSPEVHKLRQLFPFIESIVCPPRSDPVSPLRASTGTEKNLLSMRVAGAFRCRLLFNARKVLKFCESGFHKELKSLQKKIGSNICEKKF